MSNCVRINVTRTYDNEILMLVEDNYAAEFLHYESIEDFNDAMKPRKITAIFKKAFALERFNDVLPDSLSGVSVTLSGIRFDMNQNFVLADFKKTVDFSVEDVVDMVEEPEATPS